MGAINHSAETEGAQGHKPPVSEVMDNIDVSVHHSEMVCALMGACETKSITLVYALSRVISLPSGSAT